jgi:hypothetical protein
MLLTDALAEAGDDALANGKLRFALADPEERIELRVGPLAQGAAEHLRATLNLPGPASLETLADEVAVETVSDGELLVIAFTVEGGAAVDGG